MKKLAIPTREGMVLPIAGLYILLLEMRDLLISEL